MYHPRDRIEHTTAFVTPVVEHWLKREIAQWVLVNQVKSGLKCTFRASCYSTCLSWSHTSVINSWCDGSSDLSFMVDPLCYFSFQPVFHDWCNKGRGMYYPVCGMMHIKEPLLLIGNSSSCGGSEFLLLSEWSFTICLTPYNRN